MCVQELNLVSKQLDSATFPWNIVVEQIINQCHFHDFSFNFQWVSLLKRLVLCLIVTLHISAVNNCQNVITRCYLSVPSRVAETMASGSRFARTLLFPSKGKEFPRWQSCTCSVGRKGRSDVASWVAVGLDMCLREHERQADWQQTKDREGGRYVMLAKPHWFIWQMLDGGLSKRGRLHHCLTSDMLGLLEWTQLSLLNLHPGMRDELSLGRTHTTNTHTYLQPGHRKHM